MDRSGRVCKAGSEPIVSKFHALSAPGGCNARVAQVNEDLGAGVRTWSGHTHHTGVLMSHPAWPVRSHRSAAPAAITVPAQHLPATAGAGSVVGQLKVLVCDDHDVYRLGLRSVLAGPADMTLIGEATQPAAALTLAFDMNPDVVLLGRRLAGDETTDLIGRLGRADTAVIVLAESDEEAGVIDALRAGARGYLPRWVSADRLVDAIREVARHETVLDSSVTGYLLRFLEDPPPTGGPAGGRTAAQGGSPGGADVDPAGELTPRQREIACLVGDGLSNAEVAGRLYLSQATVKSHLTVILKRLGVRDRTQLAIMINRSVVTEATTAEPWSGGTT